MKDVNNRYPLYAGFIAMALFGAAFLVLGSILPSITERFSLEISQSAILTGLLPFGLIFGALIFGPASDKFGYKITLSIYSLITSIALLILAFTNDLSTIKFSILFLGVGGGMLNGASNALVSDVSTNDNRTSNMSILGVFYAIGALIVPLLVRLLSELYSYKPILLGLSFILLLSIIYTLAIKFPKPKISGGFPVKTAIKMVSNPVMILLSFALFFESGLEGIAQNWISSFFIEVKDLTNQDASTALTLMIIGLLISRILMSTFLKNSGLTIILISGMAFAALGVTTFAIFGTFASALIGSFMLGFGFSVTFPIILAEIGNKFKELSATAFSIALVTALIGNTLMNLLVGKVGLDMFPIIVLVALLLVSTLFYANSRIKSR